MLKTTTPTTAAAVQCLFYDTTHSHHFWNDIILSLFGTVIDNDEALLLTQLKNRGVSSSVSPTLSWLSFVPISWQILYGNVYDTIHYNAIHSLTITEINKIDKDIYRTFSVFVRNTQIGKLGLKLLENYFCSSLRHLLILLAYHMGYTQGMNYLVAMILLILSSSSSGGTTLSCRQSYILLSYLLYHQQLSLLFLSKPTRRPLPPSSIDTSSLPSTALSPPTSDTSFLSSVSSSCTSASVDTSSILTPTSTPSTTSLPTPTSSSSPLSQYIKIFDTIFQRLYPILHFHLQEHNFYCYCYTVDWFTTCFIRTSPGELSLHILELLLIGLKDTLLRIGLAIMHLLHDTLLRLEEEELFMNFRSLVKQLNAREVISVAVKLQLNPKKRPGVEENILQVGSCTDTFLTVLVENL
jgi:hypothetical protein